MAKNKTSTTKATEYDSINAELERFEAAHVEKAVSDIIDMRSLDACYDADCRCNAWIQLVNGASGTPEVAYVKLFETMDGATRNGIPLKKNLGFFMGGENEQRHKVTIRRYKSMATDHGYQHVIEGGKAVMHRDFKAFADIFNLVQSKGQFTKDIKNGKEYYLPGLVVHMKVSKNRMGYLPTFTRAFLDEE